MLGYFDDLVLVPIGIWLALKMIPADVMEECRERARETVGGAGPTSRVAAGVIIAVWLATLALVVILILRAT